MTSPAILQGIIRGLERREPANAAWPSTVFRQNAAVFSPFGATDADSGNHHPAFFWDFIFRIRKHADWSVFGIERLSDAVGGLGLWALAVGGCYGAVPQRSS